MFLLAIVEFSCTVFNVFDWLVYGVGCGVLFCVLYLYGVFVFVNEF